jgi:ParB-like chromosome segregation protein Spo0J
MEVIQVPINKLKPAEYNPRQMTEKQAEDLRESIRRFGMVDPLIVNKAKGRKNVIIGGHQRYNIALEMGITELPCVYVNLDEEKERELNLRLNKNLGEWDWDLLPNFDVEMLLDVGFTSEEINKYLDLDIFNPVDESEQSRLDEKKKVKCPECGHEFTP